MSSTSVDSSVKPTLDDIISAGVEAYFAKAIAAERKKHEETIALLKDQYVEERREKIKSLVAQLNEARDGLRKLTARVCECEGEFSKLAHVKVGKEDAELKLQYANSRIAVLEQSLADKSSDDESVKAVVEDTKQQICAAWKQLMPLLPDEEFRGEKEGPFPIPPNTVLLWPSDIQGSSIGFFVEIVKKLAHLYGEQTQRLAECRAAMDRRKEEDLTLHQLIVDGEKQHEEMAVAWRELASVLPDRFVQNHRVYPIHLPPSCKLAPWSVLVQELCTAYNEKCTLLDAKRADETSVRTHYVTRLDGVMEERKVENNKWHEAWQELASPGLLADEFRLPVITEDRAKDLASLTSLIGKLASGFNSQKESIEWLKKSEVQLKHMRKETEKAEALFASKCEDLVQYLPKWLQREVLRSFESFDREAQIEYFGDLVKRLACAFEEKDTSFRSTVSKLEARESIMSKHEEHISTLWRHIRPLLPHDFFYPAELDGAHTTKLDTLEAIIKRLITDASAKNHPEGH